MSSTAKWIIGVLISISLATSGYVVGRIDLVNKDLQDYKMMVARETLGLSREQVNIMKEYVLIEKSIFDSNNLSLEHVLNREEILKLIVHAKLIKKFIRQKAIAIQFSI